MTKEERSALVEAKHSLSIYGGGDKDIHIKNLNRIMHIIEMIDTPALVEQGILKEVSHE